MPGRRRSSLGEYHEKRDFDRTAEPAGEVLSDRAGPLIFVVQKHAARRLHYDFRLEVDGVLKSWPLPKGPSYDPGQRRLAVMTEDHPLDYATFEGVIPKGEYGGGQVIVWDAGVYAPEIDGRPCFERAAAERHLRRAIEDGKLTVMLHGRKLRGTWSLVRKSGDEWLFLKKDDATADRERDVLAQDASVLSDLTIDALKAGCLPERRRTPSLLTEPADEPGARRLAIPSRFQPMLPSLAERPFSHPEWLFAPKLDGYRVAAFVQERRVRLVSRGGLDVTEQYPWLAEDLARQPFDNAVLDGEVVALDEQGRPSFQLLQNHAVNPSVPLRFFAFDLLHLDGADLRRVPLERRLALLDLRVVPSGGIQVVEHYPEHGVAVYEAALAQGLEGVVAKQRTSTYAVGRRSRAWLKVKSVLTEDVVVAGYTRGTGARAATFGSLLVGSYADDGRLVYAGHVGTGFDDAMLAALLARLDAMRADVSSFDAPLPPRGRWARADGGPVTWVRPELVVEVKYAERTDSGILRTPVFLRVRDDKPSSAVRALDVSSAPTESDMASDDVASEARRVLEQLDSKSTQAVIDVDGHEVRLSSLDKILWPRRGKARAHTKRHLAAYLMEVAPYLLPHLRDRPLTLVRYPNGIDSPHFYQKHWDGALPPFVETVRLYSDHTKSDGEYVLCNNLPTLLWLAQVASLELHSWYSRTDPEPDAEHATTTFVGSLGAIEMSVLNYPDFVVFDLDPYLYSGKERVGAEPELHREGFAQTCEVAFHLKELLDGLALSSFVKTTGRTGLHIYVPINRELRFDETHALSETLSSFLARQHPGLVTTEWAVTKRRGKVFADYNQNGRGKTLASIYSPRVLPSAAVSMPVRWDELGSAFPTDFTLTTAPERLRAVGDLWSGILDAKHDLAAALAGTDTPEQPARTRRQRHSA